MASAAVVTEVRSSGIVLRTLIFLLFLGMVLVAVLECGVETKTDQHYMINPDGTYMLDTVGGRMVTPEPATRRYWLVVGDIRIALPTWDEREP